MVLQCFRDTECVMLHLPEAPVVGRMKVHIMDVKGDRGAAVRQGDAFQFNFPGLGV